MQVCAYASLIVPCRLSPGVKPGSIIWGQVTQSIVTSIEDVSELSAADLSCDESMAPAVATSVFRNEQEAARTQLSIPHHAIWRRLDRELSSQVSSGYLLSARPISQRLWEDPSPFAEIATCG